METPLAACFLTLLAMLTLAVTARPENCPSVCQCTDDNKVVKCMRQSITDVPEGIPMAVEALYLSYNAITTIKNNSFAKLVNIFTLSLKGNDLVTIEDQGFNGLTNLKTLFLTDNRLVSINKEVFKGLILLENLYLSQNLLESIPDLGYAPQLRRLNLDTNKLTSAKFLPSFNNTKQLVLINLSNNQFPRVKKSDFEVLGYPGTKLETLKLSTCHIKSIDNSTFEPFAQLKSLSLSYNKLNTSNVRAIINGLRNSKVVALDLSGVISAGVLPADSFTALVNVPLTTLNLVNSDFSVIQANTFKPLPKLMHLDISHSSIAVVEEEGFVGLDNLERLVLAGNVLKNVPKKFPSKLTFLDLSKNSPLKELPENAFFTSPKLQHLIISKTGLTKIHSDTFLGVNQLEILDMSANHLGGTNIPGKALSKMPKLEKLLLNHNKISTIRTGDPLFKGLQSLKTLDLSDNDCGQIPSDIFTGLGNLRTLQLEGNKLGDSLSNFGSELFSDLGNLTSLHLESNLIKTLPASLFKGLKSLKNMSLSSNLITDWPEGASSYISHIDYLDLSYNQMSTIKVADFSSFERGFSLNLTGNPFDCWCDLRDFRQWINKTNVTLVNLTHYECNSPRTMAGKPVMAFDPGAISDECQLLPWRTILAASLAGLAGSVVITAVLSYRYRWQLRLRWFNLKRRMRRRRPGGSGGYGRLEEEGEDGFHYDAYISVCDADRDWVEQDLLPKMDKGDVEVPGVEFTGDFKLCYDERDISVGTNNYTEVGDHMLMSKKVILVLSQEYLASNRHREFDLEFAASRMPERGLHYVIPLFLDHGVDVQVPTSLRLKLERYQDRIETWNKDPDAQEVFWNKLHDLLSANPPPPHAQQA